MSKTKWFINALFLAVAVLAFSACDDEDEPSIAIQTITEIAADDPQFSTLVGALQRVNLDDVLNGDGPFTVFAPTNAAFQALGVNLNTLTDDQLEEILLYHVLGGAQIESGEIAAGQTYATTAAQTGPGNSQLAILIEKTGNQVKINGNATVTTADIVGKNGVIHVIDKVLLPLDVVGHAAANSNFTQLVGALGAASGNLTTVLSGTGPFTVFAPLNSAFEAIAGVTAGLTPEQLSKVLTYHVAAGNVRSSALTNGQTVTTVNGETFTVNISGNNVTITDAKGEIATVVLTDVQATNGVIHVINKVILPENL